MLRRTFDWRANAAMVFLAFLVASSAAGQATSTVTGRVTDDRGSPVAGVQMVMLHTVTGQQSGGLTGDNGRYLVPGLRPGGPYRVEARMIGYGLQVAEDITLVAGQTRTIDFTMSQEAIALDAIEIFASRAVERKTPVAYSDIPKVQIQQQLGSRDIPLVLNTKPSVYATAAGGGAGDARMTIRGFNQRNVSVMINGVPVNDMENGWVYWSNWDGVGDASASIQLQRGLSAVNLATPSIGGTFNIITDPSAMRPGFFAKQEFGTEGFLKTTVTGATGLMNNKFSLMASGVRKTGEGLFDGTWTDAWAYYLAAAYHVNEKHRLHFFALGAPQRHGQNSYMLNIATISRSFAEGLDDYDPGALEDFPEAGRRWSPNYGTVSSSYGGRQYTSTGPGSGTFSRYSASFINERENYFHKPQVNLNWYYYIKRGLTLSTVAYFSGGDGGGTGTLGSLAWDYTYTQRFPDWDGTIDRNQANADGARGILRNSVNNQWTIGAISKLKMEVSEPVTLEVGLDWRTAEIEHYREVRDLLGAQYFRCNSANRCGSSDFWTSESDFERVLGDQIDYNFTNTVDWFGGYFQGEYTEGRFSAYGMTGVSTIKYTYTNHFRDDGTGNELFAETDNIWGFQVKGGGLYNLTDEFELFANAGFVSKVPIFDGVIDDYAGAINPDPKNEKFTSVETGVTYRRLDRSLTARFNLYFTQWNDRTQTRGVTLEDGSDALFNLLGLNARHMGAELEVAFQPIDLVRLDVGGSLASWTYTDDVEGTYRPSPSEPPEPFNFFVKDLKVGDAPQTQLYYGLSVYPIQGLYLNMLGKTFTRHYGEFDPFSRDDETDRKQSWQTPGYTVFDFHAGYDLPISQTGFRIGLFANVFNMFDTEYIQDAVDNSEYNGYDGDHDADDAEVFFGLRRTFNVGLQVRY